MYAQLGSLIFEPLSGFTAFAENEESVIAEYGALKGKPHVDWMAPGARELTIGVKLHQRFIKVKEAREQLRAYKDNGTVIPLLWGNGSLEGRFLIQRLDTIVTESDAYGNVFCVEVGIVLKESTQDLLAVKKVDATKDAFGLTAFVLPQLPVRPEPHVSRFLKILRFATKYANLIRGLSYGGAVPGSSLGGGSLTTIMARAHTNLILLQSHYGIYGSDWDIPDLSAEISASIAALTTLSAIVPSTDPAGFAAANGVYQSAIVALKGGSWILQAREATRSAKMIF